MWCFAYSRFELDEKNIRSSVVAVHTSALQELHLYIEQELESHEKTASVSVKQIASIWEINNYWSYY